ncbi:MAG: DUF2934 domain-containing protein [Candidatus Omnitrophota bacterium]
MARIAGASTGSLKPNSAKDHGSLVQKKAYELYVKRGKRPGHELDDWLEAERLIRQKAGI